MIRPSKIGAAIVVPAVVAAALVLWLAPSDPSSADPGSSAAAAERGDQPSPRRVVLGRAARDDDGGGRRGRAEPAGVGRRPPPPVEIAVPQVGIEAPIRPVTAAPDGIRVPGVERAGWLAGGPRPAEPGRTVVVGHLDSTDGPAIFANVPSIEPGTEIEVTDADGRTHRYLSREPVNVSKSDFPADSVYGSTPRSTLVLITCGGDFDPDSGYEENVVVFARPA